jgi:predicted SprT family Zn-dependent metalloprotease
MGSHSLPVKNSRKQLKQPAAGETQGAEQQNVMQLALPGLGSAPAAPFDAVQFVTDTFSRHMPGAPGPVVAISRRMLRTLGSFTPTKNLVRLSARLLTLGSDEEQKQVALHEVAHAIVHHRSPKAPAHGKEFRAACRELGLKPGRYVSVDNAQWRERLRYACKCPGCGETLLRRKRVARVRCDCGMALKPRAWKMVAMTGSGVRAV